MKKNEKKLIGYGYNSENIYANYANQKSEEREEEKDSIINKIKLFITKIYGKIENKFANTNPKNISNSF